MIKISFDKKKARKKEFSKKILTFSFFFTVLITGFTLYMIYETKDLTPLQYLIPAVFLELSSATGFYLWKAKKENEIKLKKIYGDLTGDELDE